MKQNFLRSQTAATVNRGTRCTADSSSVFTRRFSEGWNLPRKQANRHWLHLMVDKRCGWKGGRIQPDFSWYIAKMAPNLQSKKIRRIQFMSERQSSEWSTMSWQFRPAQKLKWWHRLGLVANGFSGVSTDDRGAGRRWPDFTGCLSWYYDDYRRDRDNVSDCQQNGRKNRFPDSFWSVKVRSGRRDDCCHSRRCEFDEKDRIIRCGGRQSFWSLESVGRTKMYPKHRLKPVPVVTGRMLGRRSLWQLDLERFKVQLFPGWCKNRTTSSVD